MQVFNRIYRNSATSSQLNGLSYDSEIGELPLEWNWLASEYDDNNEAKLIHYTIGTPCFTEFQDASMSQFWHESYAKLREGKE